MRGTLCVLLLIGLFFVGCFGQQTSCNCVAFRLDDVQDFFCSKAQAAIMQVFQNTSTPLTIAIIANHFGTDSMITNYVANSAQSKSWELEIASHGYNHEDFTTFDLETQTFLMHQSKFLIQFFTGVIPITFVPPFNAWDVNTTTAMRANALTHLSAQTSTDRGPYPLVGGNPYHFPIGASTADLNNEIGSFLGKSAEVTFSQIIAQINSFGYSAVMMHGQEFTMQNNTDFLTSIFISGEPVNDTQINELVRLVQMVKQAGINIVPIGRINLDAPANLRFGGITQTYASPVTCNCVAFRLDSVQDFFLSNAEQAIINTFGQATAPLTLAVIAQYFGQDYNLLKTYQSKLGNFQTGIELATSGLVGADYSLLPNGTQSKDLASAIRTIKQNFGVSVTTFTPMFGNVEADIFNVAMQNGITQFSSVERTDKPPYNISNPPLWHLSSSVYTSNPSTLSSSLPPNGYPASTVFSQIQAQLQKDGFAVVTMTAQEFAAWNGVSYDSTLVNATAIKILADVLNMVQMAGIHISTISDIPRYVATNGTAIYGTTTSGTVSNSSIYGCTTLLLMVILILYVEM